MRLATVLCLACCLLLSSIAFAAAPLNGVYKSETIGGPMYEGTGTESWAAPAGWVQVGNVINLASLKAGVLASQWYLSCPTTTAAPTLIFNNVNVNGTGTRIYAVNYAGGTFWLSGGGPWGNGDPSYLAAVDTYSETIVLSYLNWVVTGANMTISAVNGHFLGYPETCFSFGIGDKVLRGYTDTGVKPATYPDFLAPDCNPTRVYGHWDDVEDLTLTILGCQVPAQTSTWGEVKALYRD